MPAKLTTADPRKYGEANINELTKKSQGDPGAGVTRRGGRRGAGRSWADWGPKSSCSRKEFTILNPGKPEPTCIICIKPLFTGFTSSYTKLITLDVPGCGGGVSHACHYSCVLSYNDSRKQAWLPPAAPHTCFICHHGSLSDPHPKPEPMRDAMKKIYAR